MSATETTPPEPRRFSIGLPRPLWVGVAGVVLVVVAIVLPIYRQHVAIREIERLGGTVQVRNTCPGWLRPRLADCLVWIFDTAYDAGFLDADDPLETRLQDRDLRHLAGLNELEGLALAETQTTDAALSYIAGLSRIEEVLIWEPRVTDEGLVHLRNLKRLNKLDLKSTHITDAGLEHLKSLPRLKRLILREVDVSHAAVEALKRINPELDVLVLSAAYHSHPD